MRHRTVVVGSSFAGLTAALELKHHLGDSHDVVVVSKSEEFVFLPSLVWVPFGLRNRADLTFAVGPVLEKKGVLFRQGEVLSIDLDARCLHLRPIDTPPGWRPTDAPAAPSARSIDEGGEVALEYDTLVIATGPALAYDELPAWGRTAASRPRSSPSTRRSPPRGPSRACWRTQVPWSSAPPPARRTSASPTSSCSTWFTSCDAGTWKTRCP